LYCIILFVKRPRIAAIPLTPGEDDAMKRLFRGLAILVALLIPLAAAQTAPASVISFEFSASGGSWGQGRIDALGTWWHEPSVINNASTPGDPVVGNLAGFSPFNFWDAVGLGEYPLDYGQTYDIRPGFSLPFFDGEFRVWDESIGALWPFSDAIFGGALNLSTITMASDGMGFSLSGTLSDMWFDNSIASSVLSDIASAPSADFSLFVAVNKDLVNGLNRFKGNIRTTVTGGSLSAIQAQATPEPASIALMALGLGMLLLFYARQR
jgi:hypothetical protein